MAEPQHWLKGQLTGTCLGKPTRKRGGSGLARWYQLQLVDAVVSDWEPVAGPPTAAPASPAPFCQAALKDVLLRSRTPGGGDEELELRELSVWSWKISDQREAGGESRCTLRGTVYGRVLDGTRRPALAEGADRLGGWGCLAVLAGLLVASWLWWSCGPVTCGVWAAVVLTSWWSHRLRTRRRTPPALLSQILQGVLGFALILGGAGLVLGMADPARAASCGDSAVVAVLLAMGGVVGVSLLSISWPLPWSWMLWTLVVVLWCGRTGTDCAVVWARQAQDLVVGKASPRGVTPIEIYRRLTGSGGPGSGGPGSGGPGSGGPGSGGPGSGGPGSGGPGSGGPGSGGPGSGGPGSGGPGSGGPGSGGPGSGGPGSGGPGSGGPGSGGPGSGGPGSGGPGSGGPGSGGPGSGGPGSGGPGSGGPGSGGPGSGGPGSGGPGSGGPGSGGPGSGGPGSGGPGSGGPGSGGPGSGGPGSGGPGSGGPGSGGPGSGGPGGGRPAADKPGDDNSLEAAAEQRTGVESALSDPQRFLDGSTRITLAGDLLFDLDEDTIRPEAEPKLRQVADLLRQHPRQRVVVEGHADTSGGDQYNQDLSERRAQAIRTWLVERSHINPAQMDTVGFGSSRPVVPASRNPAAQRANRRVEIHAITETHGH